MTAYLIPTGSAILFETTARPAQTEFRLDDLRSNIALYRCDPATTTAIAAIPFDVQLDRLEAVLKLFSAPLFSPEASVQLAHGEGAPAALIDRVKKHLSQYAASIVVKKDVKELAWKQGKDVVTLQASDHLLDEPASAISSRACRWALKVIDPENDSRSDVRDSRRDSESESSGRLSYSRPESEIDESSSESIVAVEEEGITLRLHPWQLRILRLGRNRLFCNLKPDQYAVAILDDSSGCAAVAVFTQETISTRESLCINYLSMAFDELCGVLSTVPNKASAVGVVRPILLAHPDAEHDDALHRLAELVDDQKDDGYIKAKAKRVLRKIAEAEILKLPNALVQTSDGHFEILAAVDDAQFWDMRPASSDRRFKIECDIETEFDMPLDIELASDLGFDLDAQNNWHFARTTSKEIALIAYCASTCRAAFVQIGTTAFEDNLRKRDRPTMGLMDIFKVLVTAHEDATEADMQFTVVCKKGTMGHSKANDLVDKFVADFDKILHLYNSNADSPGVLARPTVQTYAKIDHYVRFGIRHGEFIVRLDPVDEAIHHDSALIPVSVDADNPGKTSYAPPMILVKPLRLMKHDFQKFNA